MPVRLAEKQDLTQDFLFSRLIAVWCTWRMRASWADFKSSCTAAFSTAFAKITFLSGGCFDNVLMINISCYILLFSAKSSCMKFTVISFVWAFLASKFFNHSFSENRDVETPDTSMSIMRFWLNRRHGLRAIFLIFQYRLDMCSLSEGSRSIRGRWFAENLLPDHKSHWIGLKQNWKCHRRSCEQTGS